MTLLGQIALFIVAALGLGFGVGWLTWRVGRHSVPNAEWTRQQRQLEQLSGRTAELEAQLRASEEARLLGQADHQQNRLQLELSHGERDQLLRRLELAEREAIDARHARDEALARMSSLQRRLAELSINRARSATMPSAVAPAPAAPELRAESVVDLAERGGRARIDRTG